MYRKYLFTIIAFKKNIHLIANLFQKWTEMARCMCIPLKIIKL